MENIWLKENNEIYYWMMDIVGQHIDITINKKSGEIENCVYKNSIHFDNSYTTIQNTKPLLSKKEYIINFLSDRYDTDITYIGKINEFKNNIAYYSDKFYFNNERVINGILKIYDEYEEIYNFTIKLSKGIKDNDISKEITSINLENNSTYMIKTNTNTTGIYKSVQKDDYVYIDASDMGIAIKCKSNKTIFSIINNDFNNYQKQYNQVTVSLYRLLEPYECINVKIPIQEKSIIISEIPFDENVNVLLCVGGKKQYIEIPYTTKYYKIYKNSLGVILRINNHIFDLVKDYKDTKVTYIPSRQQIKEKIGDLIIKRNIAYSEYLFAMASFTNEEYHDSLAKYEQFEEYNRKIDNLSNTYEILYSDDFPYSCLPNMYKKDDKKDIEE